MRNDSVTTWEDVLQPGFARSYFERRPLPAFDTGATGYHPANAWWLAELSRLVYRHDIEESATPLQPLRSQVLAAAGLRQLAFFQAPNTDTQGILVRSDGLAPFAALVFRGTEGKIRDIAHDLEVRMRPLRNHAARVHEGFSRALDAVWDRVAAELDRLDCPVWYAGHSLGAAVATVAAARRAPRAVYTFGSPRVGNAAFATALADVPVFRVVNGEDMVATVPPESLGYRHVGELHRLAAPPGSTNHAGFAAWLHGLKAPPKPLADHAPASYVERLA
jgi:pimeloyl-ACP methyl ester carboxylesterase